jgi:hypothetical protein
MRNGFLGAMLAVTACAGMAWGQYPPGGNFGNTAVIPPPLPGAPYGGDPGDGGDPANGPQYPAPTNWDGFDLNGPAGGNNGSVPRWWVSGEVLLWFGKATRYNPPVATTSSANDAGLLGNPSTQVVYGQQSIDFGLMTGWRVDAGGWFDASGRLGLTADGFSTGSRGKQFLDATNGSGSPLLARPFVNDQNNTTGAYVVAAPNFATGYIYDNTSTSTFGGDMNLMLNLYRSAPDSSLGYGLSFLAGFRFMQVSDHVDLASSTDLLNGSSITFQNQTFKAMFGVNSTVTQFFGSQFSGNPPSLKNLFQLVTTTVGSNTVTVNNLDQYHTRNDFYGSDFGLYQQFNYGRWSLGMGATVGLGDMHESADIAGGSTLAYNSNITTSTSLTKGLDPVIPKFASSSTSTAIANLSASGGVYAQTNAIGHYVRDTFAAVPELNLKLAYAFTPAITGYVGYNVLYVSNVIRASDLVTGLVNPALLPVGAAYGSPSTIHTINPFPSTDYWLQGINLGICFRY